MKSFIFLLLLLSSFVVKAQDFCDFGRGDVTDIIWCGLDYSEVYLPPSFVAEMDREKMDTTKLHKIFSKINQITLRDYDKFDFGSMFLKSAYIDTLAVNRANRTCNLSYNFRKHDSITEDAVPDLLADLNFRVDTGYGVILFANYVGFRKNVMNYVLVIFDMNTKSPLLVKPIEVKTSGSAIYANFLHTVLNLVKEVHSNLSAKWLKAECEQTPVETRPAYVK